MLTALALNCSLNNSSKDSHTQTLIDRLFGVVESLGVRTKTIRLADKRIPPGITDDAGEGDEWPQVLDEIRKADILVFGSPIWMGQLSSVGQLALERLNGSPPKDKQTGQFILYNKVVGFAVTGNEDGAQNTIRQLMLALNHLGATVPPNVDTYWLGEAGPGPSYGDDGTGLDHEYTNKTTLYAAHNLVWFARLLREHPIPTNLKTLGKRASEGSLEAMPSAVSRK